MIKAVVGAGAVVVLKLMGVVFGRTETHGFRVLETKNGYERRLYDVAKMIETDRTKDGFMTLAGYIGVMTKPQNVDQTKIAMTTPVISSAEIKLKFRYSAT